MRRRQRRGSKSWKCEKNVERYARGRKDEGEFSCARAKRNEKRELRK